VSMGKWSGWGREIGSTVSISPLDNSPLGPAEALDTPVHLHSMLMRFEGGDVCKVKRSKVKRNKIKRSKEAVVDGEAEGVVVVDGEVDVPRSAVVRLVCSDSPTAIVAEWESRWESRHDSATEPPCRYTLTMHSPAACDRLSIQQHREWTRARRRRRWRRRRRRRLHGDKGSNELDGNGHGHGHGQGHGHGHGCWCAHVRCIRRPVGVELVSSTARLGSARRSKSHGWCRPRNAPWNAPRNECTLSAGGWR
jgi:hypothetical protein